MADILRGLVVQTLGVLHGLCLMAESLAIPLALISVAP